MNWTSGNPFAEPGGHRAPGAATAGQSVGLSDMGTHRQIHQTEDGLWVVWCTKHGKRHTKTIMDTEAEAVSWWQQHTGKRKNRGGAWCPHPTDVPPVPVNPFQIDG